MRILNKDEYTYIREVFTRDAQVEFVLNKTVLQENEVNALEASILSIIASTKLYNLFTPGAMENMVGIVFNDNNLRDYVLGLTDRFFCNIACIAYTGDINDAPLEATIAAGLRSLYEKSMNLGVPIVNNNVTPDKIVDNITVNFDLVFNVLKHNKWLVSIVLMILFIEQINSTTP
jgi:hypothetical protein